MQYVEVCMTTTTRKGPALLLGLALSAVASSSWAGDPTNGDCIRASESEIQLRKDLRLREAREQALVCAAASCPADVRSECERRLEGLNQKIPTIIFEVRGRSGHDLSSVTVTVDGRVLTTQLDGTELSLDPGSHAFAFDGGAEGHYETTLLIRETEKARRERVTLEVSATPPEPPPTPPPVTPPPPVASHSLGPLPWIGFTFAGLGLITGVVTGSMALSRASDAKLQCVGNVCPRSVEPDVDASRTLGTVSTVAFIVAGVGAVVGVTALVIGLGRRSAAVKVGLSSVAFEWRF